MSKNDTFVRARNPHIYPHKIVYEGHYETRTPSDTNATEQKFIPERTVVHQGKSLRDDLAGDAMKVLLADGNAGNKTEDDIAKGAYEMADAMLRAR